MDPKESTAVTTLPGQQGLVPGTPYNPPPRRTLISTMAEKYGLGSSDFLNAIKQTIMPAGASDAQTAAFLVVANRYNLDPFIRQIYAFPTKSGGIQPVVSVDGWLSIMQGHAAFDGYEYEEILEGSAIIGGKITIWRKDRTRPTIHREWFSENKRNTSPWNDMPRRMMENRTAVQGIRRAFNVSGIMDPEEAERMAEINVTSQSTELSRTTASASTDLKTQISNGIATAKEKISKRKAAEQQAVAATAPPAAPPITEPAVAPDPPPVTAAPPDRPPKQPPLMPAMSTTLDVDLTTGEIIDDDLANLGPAPNDLLTDADRNAFLNILKSRPGDVTAKQLATKKQLISLGLSNTKEIQYRHYDGLKKWAGELTV